LPDCRWIAILQAAKLFTDGDIPDRMLNDGIFHERKTSAPTDSNLALLPYSGEQGKELGENYSNGK
jgi:hypothetical protein